jgi:hypothetical protein
VKKHIPLNPTHHIWRRQKTKEDKTNIIWKCKKCKTVKIIEKGPGWLKPDPADCSILHGSTIIPEESMKSYPSFDNRICNSVDIYAFDKLDGSNIRAEWSQKRGFYKFGTRKRMIDHKDKHLGKAVLLIKAKYEKDLDAVFRRSKPIQRFQRGVVCYFEFLGPKSFAGQHARDDEHDVILFDVSPFKSGLIPPNEFVKLFGHLHIPKVLYQGKAGKEFADSVRNSSLEGMSFEGVVCKAPNPNRKKTSHPIMFKIKSDAWLEKLKEHCAGDTKMYERLL